ncbi:MAG: hypothetical protein L0Y60_12315 [Beijerinckiaceae bacterium]|nr:hypothetical protein [Beijerinckiaceae bacterium]
MADYYPLLAKAVAGLTDSTPEARHAIYERARNALFGQLRNLDPPVPDEAIEREAQALEVAVAQLETEIAPSTPGGSMLPLVEPELSDLGLASVGSPAYAPDTSGRDVPSTAPFMPEANQSSGAPVAPLQETPKLPSARPLKVRRQARDPGLNPAAESGATSPGEIPSAWPRFSGDGGMPRPEPPDLEAPFTQSLNPAAPDAGPVGFDGPARMRLEAYRTFAPEPPKEGVHPKRLMMAGGAVGLVVLLVAIAAYKLRDRPEDLVRVQSPPVQADARPGGKIADRVGAGSTAAGSAPASADAPSPADRSGAARTGSSAFNPPIPVARRAALLVKAPGEHSEVKTYLGTVVWRVENVSSGPDEPLRMAVYAEVEIPEEKLRADMTIQKNFDNTLPASHTVKLHFAVPPDSPLGSIKQISELQMRQEDTPTGDALKGITVPIVENSFLIGLARGDAEASNLERLRSREWLDVPMVLASGHIGKLTFEKGASGQRVFNDAMASWQAQ